MPTHGKATHVAIDNSIGALTPVQTWSRSAAYSESIDTADTSNFGQNDKTYITGMADATFELGGTFEPAFLTLVRATKAAIMAGTLVSCSVRTGWAGNATAQAWEECETLITAINVSSQTSDVVTMTVSFQRTGPLTTGTYG